MFIRYGKKTTVDQLVQMAGIAKVPFINSMIPKKYCFHCIEDYRKSLLKGWLTVSRVKRLKCR